MMMTGSAQPVPLETAINSITLNLYAHNSEREPAL